MARQTVALTLSTPTNYDVLAFRYFILSLNKLQSIYEFSFPDLPPSFEGEVCSEDEILDKSASFHAGIAPKTDYLIVITTCGIEGNLFFTSRGSVAVITTDTWEAYFSPPSLFEYLLHCISASLLFMHPSLNLTSHFDTRGCVLDFTRLKADDRIDIALGYICDSDCAHIVANVGEDFLNQIRLVISRGWIGTIQEEGSVAYNLKHLFRFDITRDSGFNKTFWERAKTKFDEAPFEFLKIFIQAVIAFLLAALLFYFKIKS
jgi:hypothetical protein